MNHFPIQPRDKRKAIHLVELVHRHHCPVHAAHPDQRPKAADCGCAIGITYRLLCDLATDEAIPSRFTDPAYAKAERKVARAERSIRRTVR